MITRTAVFWTACSFYSIQINCRGCIISNQTIYEEFLKSVGKKRVRNYTYIRTQCKNCSDIIEYQKRADGKHKGHCVECCRRKKRLQLTGKKFGHLTVISQAEKTRQGRTRWLCQCSCGSVVTVAGANLNSGGSRSCCCGHGLTAKKYIMSKVKITEDGRWLWQGLCNRSGYGKLCWKGKDWSAHRFSFHTFKGEIPPEMFVCHKNDCPGDVNPDNLFLGTHRDNTNDMVQKGRQAFGSKNGSAKIGEEEVKQIMKLILDKVTYKKIAEKFGVSTSCIDFIRQRKTWKHVPNPQEEII